MFLCAICPDLKKAIHVGKNFAFEFSWSWLNLLGAVRPNLEAEILIVGSKNVHIGRKDVQNVPLAIAASAVTLESKSAKLLAFCQEASVILNTLRSLDFMPVKAHDDVSICDCSRLRGLHGDKSSHIDIKGRKNCTRIDLMRIRNSRMHHWCCMISNGSKCFSPMPVLSDGMLGTICTD